MNTRIVLVSVVFALAAFRVFAEAGTPAPAATAPVLPNAGFEEDLANWTPGPTSAGMVKVLAEAAHSGAKGLRMTDSGPAEAGSLTSAPVALGGARRVTIGFWGRLVSGKGAAVTLVFFDEAGKEVKVEKAPQFGVGHANGKVYSGTADVPAGATQLRIKLRTWSPAEVTADFDDFTVTLG